VVLVAVSLRLPEFLPSSPYPFTTLIHELKLKVKSIFGVEVFSGNKIDRKKLSRLVFSETRLVEKLNSLVHPLVRKDFMDWTLKQNCGIVFKESAILFESGASRDCMKVIFVEAPEEVRIKRVKQRDNRSIENIRSIMKNQWDQNDIKEKADFVILNDGNHSIIGQVWKIYQEVLKPKLLK
jgi:dephospho-CoA kinase